MGEGSGRWAGLEMEGIGAALNLPADAATELADVLRRFYRDASLAVPSLIGMRLTCRLAAGDAAHTTMAPSSTADDVVASLQISLPLPADPDAGVCLLTLYAGQTSAFAADLADGLRDALGTDGGELLLDQQLKPAGSDLSAFEQTAEHQMAEGVLLGRGFSEIGAATFLEALTAASHGDVSSAAQQVIESVR